MRGGCVSFDRIQPPENPSLLMCAERVGGLILANMMHSCYLEIKTTGVGFI